MTDTLASALVAAQQEMPKVDKDATNPHFRSQFTSLDHLIAVTRPVLNKHGLAIMQSPTHVDGAPALATTLYHAGSGESSRDVMLLLLTKNDMQGLGGAITYGRRYMWAALLGIASEEDDDGNAASATATQTVKVASQVAAEEKTGIRNPVGDLRSDAQAKLLYVLFEKLEKAGAITLEQFLSAARIDGANSAQGVCEKVTKGQATQLIDRLKTLEANVKAAA